MYYIAKLRQNHLYVLYIYIGFRLPYNKQEKIL